MSVVLQPQGLLLECCSSKRCVRSSCSSLVVRC